MIKFIKNFFRLASNYSDFSEENMLYVVITKFKSLVKNSISMCQWDKMSKSEKELWYINESRVLEF